MSIKKKKNQIIKDNRAYHHCKKSKQRGGWGNVISWGIEEISDGNSRGQLKQN